MSVSHEFDRVGRIVVRTFESGVIEWTSVPCDVVKRFLSPTCRLGKVSGSCAWQPRASEEQWPVASRDCGDACSRQMSPTDVVSVRSCRPALNECGFELLVPRCAERLKSPLLGGRWARRGVHRQLTGVGSQPYAAPGRSNAQRNESRSRCVATVFHFRPARAPDPAPERAVTPAACLWRTAAVRGVMPHAPHRHGVLPASGGPSMPPRDRHYHAGRSSHGRAAVAPARMSVR